MNEKTAMFLRRVIKRQHWENLVMTENLNGTMIEREAKRTLSQWTKPNVKRNIWIAWKHQWLYTMEKRDLQLCPARHEMNEIHDKQILHHNLSCRALLWLVYRTISCHKTVFFLDIKKKTVWRDRPIWVILNDDVLKCSTISN